mgnify:CR=1 FL=1
MVAPPQFPPYSQLKTVGHGGGGRECAQVGARSSPSPVGCTGEGWGGGSLGRVLLAELRLAFNGRRWWWYAVLVGLNVAGLAVPDALPADPATGAARLTLADATGGRLTVDVGGNLFSVLVHRQIDFILVRPAERWKAIEVRVLDEAVASDHRAIFAVLEILPDDTYRL